MANIVRFKKSSVPGKVPSPSDLSLGEIAVNTFDGKLFTKKQQGAIQKVIEIGAMESENTIYVSKSGNDSNSGKTLGEAKLTIKAACDIATPGTAIIVKSGEYIEDNPVYLPAKVAIVGDSLRTVTIRPRNTDQDIFWVNNASYIIQATFKGHVAPASAVAFPPDGSAGFIVQSPYVQNATSLTTTGTGMKVDGAVTTGLRSMVLDAFTQYNQGGVGIHMLNQGNTQLVSCFTICCDISFLCEDGGFCSITNSNTSFGRLGLVSRGASPALYFGTVKGDTTTGRVVFNNLAKKPNVGDGVLFADYNQETCERDTGLIVDSLAFDLLFDSFTQSTFSGLRYWSKDSVTIPGEVTETIAAINHAKSIAESVVRNIDVTPQAGNLLSQTKDLVNPGSVYGSRLIGQDFSLIANIIENGPKSNAIIIDPDILLGEPEYRVLRQQVLNQKTDIIEDTIDYINTNYPSLEYDQAVCRRDAGLIIDAVIDDLIFGSNYKTVTAAQLYFISDGGYFIPSDQFDETVDAIAYIKSRVSAVVNEDPTAQSIVEDRFDTIIDILNNTPTVAPTLIYTPTQDLDQDIIDAVAILRANRNFLAAETIAYINVNYPDLIYTSETCSRDVKYVIDAICYDLTYGGNSQTLRAAERYYSYLSGSVVLDSDELAATLDAYANLQLNVERALINDIIVPLQGLVVQNTSLDPATLVQISAARSLFTVLLDVIEEGITGDSDYIIPNGEVTTQTGLLNTYDLLQSNKDFIIADTVAYINNTYSGFTYDQVTCERDLGYIIDSVSFDLKYGGNRQTVQAGVYYYDFSSETNFIEGQVTQTIAALEYLKDLMEDVVTATPTSTTWQTNVEQDVTLTPATSSETFAINSRISLIQDILRNGPIGEDSTTRVKEAIGLTPLSDANVVNAFNLILANRLFIQKEMTAYINNNWFELSNGEYPYFRVADVAPLTLGTTATTLPTIENESASLLAARTTILNAKETIKTNTIAFLNANFFDNFVFDQNKCYRDVGLILDAVTEDIVFGTNYKTVIAATSYLRAYTSEVINNQKEQTIEAIEAARDFTLGLVVNLTAKQEIEANYNTLLAILDQGISAVPSLTFPNPDNVDSGITNAAAVLQANKDFIVAEVVAYINENLNAFFYDQDKCARDVGLIIDALAYDYVIGTNFQTVTAGLAYLRANASDVLVQPQKIATIDAMLYLKNELLTLIADDTAAVTSIGNGIDTIIAIIEDGSSSAPALTYPSTSITTQDQIDARTQLLQNKDFIIADVTAWIEYNYVNFDSNYNSATCQRDIGYIVDAVTYDLVTGSNFGSIVAGSAYYRALTSTETVRNLQKIQTLASIEQTKTLAAAYIDSSLLTQANALFDLIYDILDQGLSAVPAISRPNNGHVTGNINNRYAADIMIANMEFYKAEIIQFITNNYPLITYDQSKCRRDVEYVVNAVIHDTLYSGNWQSVIAGEAYYSFGTLTIDTADKAATLAAYGYLKSLLQDTVINTDVAELQVAVSQNLSLTPTSGSVRSAIGLMLDDIDLIIDTGSGTVFTVYPFVLDEPAATINTELALRTNKSTIQTGITSFITATFNGLSYDSAKCERDVGLIIDGLCYDLTYGGNWASVISANSYFVGAVSQLGSGEAVPTANAYRHMQEVVELIVTGNTVTPWSGNIETQDASGGVASTTESAEVSGLMQIIIDVIDAGDLDDLPAIQYPNISWASAIAQATHAVLLAAKAGLQTEVVEYINDKPRLIYDEALCSRDVGLIIDALTYDLYFGSNFRSIKAGQAYYRSYASEVIDEPQKRYTLLALEFVKEEVISAVTGNATAVTSVTDNMDIIIDIFDNGLDSAPTFVLPSPTGYDAGFQNARNLIVANTEFINEELEEYMTINYPEVAYDRVACRRDVEYIIDSLRYDLTYGGNTQSVAAGNAYYSGTNLQLGLGEKIPTLNTYIFLKSLLIDIAQNNSITPLQPDVAQVSGSAGSLAAGNFAAARIDEIITIINATQATPETILPSTAWVDSGLISSGSALQSAKSTIQSDTIDFINERIYFVYDQTTCERDTEYIVDALTYDLLYGGNTSVIEAGRSYFTGTGANVVTGELNETILAYQYMSTVVQKVVRNISVTPTTGNTEIQNVGLAAGSLVASDTLRDLFAVLIPIVRGGIDEEAPAVILPTFSNGNATKNNVRRNLLALRKFVQDKTLDYIISQVIRNFNQEKCARDVGLILDAVTYDMVLNSNYQSIRAGSAYQQVSARLVQEKQLGPTLRAIEFVRDAVLALVSGNATAVSRLTDRFDIIYDIIKDGESYAPVLSNPIPTGGDMNAVNAAASIQANIEFIKEETLAYVSQNYRSYDTAKCSRDLDLIINGVLYDMIFGGNYQSKKAGLSYRRVSAAYVLSDQLESTMGGIAYARDEIIDLLEGDSLAIQRVTEGFATVLDIIENGAGVAPTVNMPDGGYDTENDNGKDIILANLQFIKDEIIAYVNFNYVPGLTYDPAVCARDVGLIAEAVAYDLSYEGNSQSVDAGLQYYLKGGLVIPTTQKAETLDAINHLNSILQDLVVNTPITPTTGNSTLQNTTLPAADATTQSRINTLVGFVYDILDTGTSAAPTIVNPTVTGADSTLQDLRLAVIGSLSTIKSNTIIYINETYLGFGYNFDTCKRDIEYVLDSVCYDLIYGGNSQTKYAAEQYFAGGVLQITENERNATVAAYAYIDLLTRKIILNTAITPLQSFVTQDISNPAATSTEVNAVKALFDAATDIIINGYTCVVTLDASFRRFIANNTRASFHQQSQITSSGHTFEWVGAGNDIESALPYNGGVPIEANEIIRERGGEIYFTSTDQKGDFKIGAELTIQRDSGSIIGRAFNKSLLAVMTPYILALEGG